MNNLLTSLRAELPSPAHQPEAPAGLPKETTSQHFAEPFGNFAFTAGLALLAISGGLFLAYDWLSESLQGGQSGNPTFILHYIIAVSFSISLLTNGFLKFRRPTYAAGRPVRWLGLLLWLISAYSLNRGVTVFEVSTPWLSWAVVVVGIAMVGYCWKEALPVRAQQLLYTLLAAGWWLFAYLALYVTDLYPVSIPLLLALGLSAHTFVPLAFAITLGKRLWHDARREEHLRLGVYVGLALPIIVVSLFLARWRATINRIEQIQLEATTRQTGDLPNWVLMAQQLRPNWITNRLLLVGHTYDRGRFFDSDWGLSGLSSADDTKQHDPLVLIASRLFPDPVLPETDKFKLLTVLNDNRHSTEEKFWTGEHLIIKNIVSQVRIWPQFRLGYTEKTMLIRNQARTSTEESLLTFYLAPGSVVSSMSLWVNGREEPARLTTVAKADSAYRQIVGVESKALARDPSVVYWQEGNRITVRVFPCQAGEDRRVKLGITAPLLLTNGQLTYQNPYFDGPSATLATEQIQIDFAQAPADLQLPSFLPRPSTTSLTHQGRYTPEWSLHFTAPPLSTEPFLLDGRAYRAEPYKAVNEPFRPKDVYIDANESWTETEFETAFLSATHTNHCRVWVFDDGLKLLTPTNLDETFSRLAQQRFSLFPVYRISDPTTALLITKGTPVSPTLSDLKNTPFADRMQQTARQHSPIRTFCYGSDLSPYLKTLAELRVVTLCHGDIADLTDGVLKAGQFPRQPSQSGRVVLPEADMAIRESTEPFSAGISQASAAPDHLFRLFTYNQLMQQIGRHYFAKNYQTDTLIGQARRAHIVSPLSSLVVLETAADYKRFGIQQDNAGLDNATLKQEGAVPEPQEWALLILLTGFMGWLYWKKRYAVA